MRCRNENFTNEIFRIDEKQICLVQMLKTGKNKMVVSWQKNNAVDLFSEDLLMYLVAVDLPIHYYHKHKNKSLDSFILSLLHIKHTISYQTDTLFILRCI